MYYKNQLRKAISSMSIEFNAYINGYLVPLLPFSLIEYFEIYFKRHYR